MRAKILWLVSAAYFLAGLQAYHIKAPRDQLKAADPTIEAHLDLFTVHQIGLLFMAVSVLSASIVAYEELRPRHKLAASLKANAIGYSLMTWTLMFWTALYAVSWVKNGDWHAIYGIGNYGLTVSILLLCSRIVELPEKRALPVTAVVAALEHQAEENRAAAEGGQP